MYRLARAPKAIEGDAADLFGRPLPRRSSDKACSGRKNLGARWLPRPPAWSLLDDYPTKHHQLRFRGDG